MQLKNDLYEKFSVEYLRTLDRTKAAEACGFTGLTAQVKGSRLLRVPAIEARIRQLQRELKKDSIADVEERMERLTKIVRGDVKDYLVGDRPKITRDTRNTGAVGGYSVADTAHGETRNVKILNPVDAIAELNRMDGSYPPEKHAVLGDIRITVVHKDREALTENNE